MVRRVQFRAKCSCRSEAAYWGCCIGIILHRAHSADAFEESPVPCISLMRCDLEDKSGLARANYESLALGLAHESTDAL
jgi:hypothetical protein